MGEWVCLSSDLDASEKSLLYSSSKEFTLLLLFFFIIIWCLLSQPFSSWYFSWTSGDPHRSGFKFHTAVLSVLCVMFQV